MNDTGTEPSRNSFVKPPTAPFPFGDSLSLNRLQKYLLTGKYVSFFGKNIFSRQEDWRTINSTGSILTSPLSWWVWAWDCSSSTLNTTLASRLKSVLTDVILGK